MITPRRGAGSLFGRAKQLETKVGGGDVIRMVRATGDSEIAGGGQASGFLLRLAVQL